MCHIIAAGLVNMVKDLDDKEEHMKLLAAGGFKRYYKNSIF